LKGNNLSNTGSLKQKLADSSTDLSYSHNNETSNRQPSQRMSSLGRARSSSRSSQRAPSSLPPAENKTVEMDFIIIHVLDENKKKQKYFKWSMSLLLKHMKYFENHLKLSQSSEDLDISVHWDVAVFEWLLNYIETKEKEESGNENVKFYDVVTQDGDAYKVSSTIKRK